MSGKPSENVALTHSDVSIRLGITPRMVQISEKSALGKLREGLADVEDELFDEPLRAIRSGRWNGKKIVRMG